jgi:hypothetical protein
MALHEDRLEICSYFLFLNSAKLQKRFGITPVIKEENPIFAVFSTFISDAPIFGQLSCGNCGKNVKCLIINIILVLLLTHYI